MNNHVVFATGPQDAANHMGTLGVPFTETTWFRGAKFSTGHDLSGMTIHYTDAYKESAEYAATYYLYGDGVVS